MKKRLSVVVLTKNEEDNIRECLESVKWADEIVIVDDNSTDDTVKIARAFTEKIIISGLEGNFAKQRDLGMGQCSGDWILQMDADERVTPALKDKILEAINIEGGPSAYRFRRINNFCGRFLKYGGEDSHRPVRLFKKNKASFSRAGAKIHEEVLIDGAIGDIEACMEHYNFPDISHYIATQDFYSDLEAKELFDRAPLIPIKKLKHDMMFVVPKLFMKIYIKKHAYKDGMRGFIFAVLSAWRRFLIYAKYWELNKDHYDRMER